MKPVKMKPVEMKPVKMKPVRAHTRKRRLPSLPESTAQTLETVAELWSEGRRQKLPLYLFLALCFNLVLAPIVYAAADGELSQTQSWALGVLGLSVIALSVYLFCVMFAPEKFS
jgi:hypothetical protein